MAMLMAEKGYQKNAWILLAILGVIGLIFGIALFLGLPVFQSLIENQLGQSVSSFSSSNPKAYSLIQTILRDEGAAILGVSILGIAISYKAFRRGERWAWYAELATPVFFLYLTVDNYSLGYAIWPLDAVFLLVSLAGLFLPYRKFFPKKQPMGG